MVKNFALVVLLSVSVSAQSPQTMPRDEKIEQVASDLRALARVTALASNLGDVRQVMLAIIDNDVEALREKRDDDTYRWASLQREEASRVKDETSIERVSTEGELKRVTLSASNAYRVEVIVPQKRNLVSGNNKVYVRNVIVDSTGFDGKTAHAEIPVNVWVAPGDATGVALPDIGKSVRATVELGVESGDKRAVATAALLQAKLVDDPASPYFPAVRRLLQIREFVAARDINRGQLRNAADEALLALPGELEMRAAEMAAAAERRQRASGEIRPGDASPDIVAALQEISRLSTGTLQDQADARTKLDEIIRALQPPAAQP
jgi:hypothetical protein